MARSYSARESNATYSGTLENRVMTALEKRPSITSASATVVFDDADYKKSLFAGDYELRPKTDKFMSAEEVAKTAPEVLAAVKTPEFKEAFEKAFNKEVQAVENSIPFDDEDPERKSVSGDDEEYSYEFEVEGLETEVNSLIKFVDGEGKEQVWMARASGTASSLVECNFTPEHTEDNSFDGHLYGRPHTFKQIDTIEEEFEYNVLQTDVKSNGFDNIKFYRIK